jgi:hypothetical protein
MPLVTIGNDLIAPHVRHQVPRIADRAVDERVADRSPIGGAGFGRARKGGADDYGDKNGGFHGLEEVGTEIVEQGPYQSDVSARE